MSFLKILLIVSLRLILFETDTCEGVHRDRKREDATHDELSVPAGKIRHYHLKLNNPRRIKERKGRALCHFSPQKPRARRSGYTSKRCFDFCPYGFPPPEVSYPCGGVGWPTVPDPWWPEYGWVEGCGYPLPGGGPYSQPYPWFPAGCGCCCPKEESGKEGGKPTEAPTGGKQPTKETKEVKTQPTSPSGGSSGSASPKGSQPTTGTQGTLRTLSTSSTARDSSRNLKLHSPTVFVLKNRFKSLKDRMRLMKQHALRKIDPGRSLKVIVENFRD